MKPELQSLIKEIEKQFGVGVLSPASSLKPRTYRGSGSIALDVALGGGWGRSTIVDVIGRQSSGKTLLFEMAAVEAQRVEDKDSALYDFEGTFDPKRFAALGGDLDRLFLVRAENFGVDVGPMFLEWAADMLKLQLRSNLLACIGMDSTAAMVCKAEYDIKEDKGEEAATMAYTARGMASLLRQVVGSGLVQRSDTTLFFVSQMRDNIGGRGFKGQPPADKRTGGRALPFFAASQVEVIRGDIFKADVATDAGYIEKNMEVGHETKVRVRKNKNNAKQGRVCSFDVYSEGEVIGIDRVAELAKLAVATGLIKRSGSWYEWTDPDQNVYRVQGMDALCDEMSLLDIQSNYMLSRTRSALDLQLTATALKPEILYGEEAPEDPDEEMMRLLDERARAQSE
jgi:recombination protein RecA